MRHEAWLLESTRPRRAATRLAGPGLLRRIGAGSAESRRSLAPGQKMPMCRDFLTGATGLEPATSGVTGRRSNQLNYAPGRRTILAVGGARRVWPSRRPLLGGSWSSVDCAQFRCTSA